MIVFDLKRRFLAKTYTVGRFEIGERRICDTLEDPVRDYNKDGDLDEPGEEKVYGQTAIPYGTYPVTIVDSPKFKRRVPLLHGVKGFSAIEIHAGNTPEDTHGCILPGENTEKGKVTHSRYWEDKITEMIEKYISEGEQVFIKID